MLSVTVESTSKFINEDGDPLWMAFEISEGRHDDANGFLPSNGKGVDSIFFCETAAAMFYAADNLGAGRAHGAVTESKMKELTEVCDRNAINFYKIRSARSFTDSSFLQVFNHGTPEYQKHFGDLKLDPTQFYDFVTTSESNTFHFGFANHNYAHGNAFDDTQHTILTPPGQAGKMDNIPEDLRLDIGELLSSMQDATDDGKARDPVKPLSTDQYRAENFSQPFAAQWSGNCRTRVEAVSFLVQSESSTLAR